MSEAKRFIVLRSAQAALRKQDNAALCAAARCAKRLPGPPPAWVGAHTWDSQLAFQLRGNAERAILREVLLHLTLQVGLPSELAARAILLVPSRSLKLLWKSEQPAESAQKT